MSKLISLNGLQSLINKLKTIFLTVDDDRLYIEGPDGNLYKLVLDENFRLMLEERVSAKQVTYLISGDEYYYLAEDESGIYLTKYEGIPAANECAIVVASSKDTGMKFAVGVENGNTIFNLVEGRSLDFNQTAKYMICNDKLCYFQIENDVVNIYYEYKTLTSNINIK
jgi:hypothetical protein